MNEALVSVVIPTFGRPALVERAIRSALAQTHPIHEVIVVIDGDDPATISQLKKIDDPRLRWIVHSVQSGAGPARDTGVDAASGEWVAFLDDDDEWLPTKIERQLAAAPADKRALLMTLFRCLSSSATLIKPTRPYANGEPIDEWLFDRHSWFRGGEAMLQTSALMAPREMFEHLRFRDTKQHEEWELAIRAVKELGYSFITVPEALVVYYVPGDGPSLSKTYTWQRSLAWIDGLRGLVTPRAYAGFCLTVVTQGLAGPDVAFARRTLRQSAFRHGRPTARQVFAFVLIGLVPQSFRKKVRARIGRAAGSKTQHA